MELIKRIKAGDRIIAGDRLGVTMEPASKVFCASCGEHIYYLKGNPQKITPGCFAPLEGREKPEDLNCPACGRTCVAFEGNRIKIKTDRGYLG